MDAVENFLGVPENEQTPSSFLLIMGPQGSGKTFLCDKIEKRAQANSSSAQGMTAGGNAGKSLIHLCTNLFL
jgi:chromosomal replication initiation ATPase DnaA